MKIIFLCPFPISMLPIELAEFEKDLEHSAPWITTLVFSLKELYPDIEINVITENCKIRKTIEICYKDVLFHIIKSPSCFPFTKRTFPSFLPMDKILLYFFNSKKIISIIKKIGPDIVHAHGTEFSYAISAIRSGYKYIISIQGLLNLIFDKENKFFFRLAKYLERESLIKGINFIPKTNFVKDYIKSINKDAVFFDNYDPINQIYFDTTLTYNKKKQIVFVGSLIPKKGIEDLLFAVSEIENYKLIIIGSAPSDLVNKSTWLNRIFKREKNNYVHHLNEIIERNNLGNNVKFMGKQYPTTIANTLSKTRVLVLPSYMENSPNCIIEALAVGVPVVAYGVGGIPSLITDNYNGFLVEKGDIPSLTNKINLILNDDRLFKKLSQNAKISVVNKYEPEIVAKNTYQTYLKIMEL